MTEETKLLADILHAFAGVSLDDGCSLNMAVYRDSGCTAARYLDKAKADERLDWTAIPDDIIAEYSEVFCFTDLQGYRFYLPAYMSWVIRNHGLTTSVSAFHVIFAINPGGSLFITMPFVKYFTGNQIDVIEKFLEFASRQELTLDTELARERLAAVKEARLRVV
jgi:hypothetical protein